jgi:hypothetical protein
MTLALSGYSAVFMRYAFAVTPKNYLLFGCHAINFTSQVTQGYRFLSYWNFGGRERALASSAKLEGKHLAKEAEGVVNQAKSGLNEIGGKISEAVGK